MGVKMNAVITKQNLRKKYRILRDALSPLSSDETRQFEALLSQLLKGHSVIGGYMAFANEVSITHSFFDRSGFEYAVPVVKAQGDMDFVKVNPQTQFSRNIYGIDEPALDASKVVEPDCLVMPLLAFDMFGNRLGYGGGYYDRYLARYQRRHGNLPTRIGVARNEQHIEGASLKELSEPHDIVMDYVVTPIQIYAFK
tara:strand:- start:241 stop:831 length:591 start_codon:yes stop_codon:yes gene_type:complete